MESINIRMLCIIVNTTYSTDRPCCLPSHCMAPPRPDLPSDCLLHVLLHLDPVSIVRCAAVSRHWRRAVIENASEIRRCQADGDGRLLLGLFYREMYSGELGFSHRSSWSPSVVGQQHWSDILLRVVRPLPAAEGTKTKLYAPLACGDGLLLLCRGLQPEMCVCNPLTGFHTSIPRPSTQLVKYSRYVLHSCHGAADDETTTSPNPDSLFQVLAVDINRDGMLRLQNYCSKSGDWGPVFSPTVDTHRMPPYRPPYSPYRADPLVFRGIVYLLCSDSSNLFEEMISHIIAVDISSTGKARMIKLPMQCSMHNDHLSTKKLLMLATSSDGERLSLLRAAGEASMEVSIWLYAAGVHGHAEDQQGTEETSSWLRWQSVDIRKLIEDAGLERYRLGCRDWTVLETRLERFCPKSQSAIIWIPYVGLFVLDLKSMRIRRAAGDSHGHIWPYEIDLTHWYPSIK
jgi:hypothetical protein